MKSSKQKGEKNEKDKTGNLSNDIINHGSIFYEFKQAVRR